MKRIVMILVFLGIAAGGYWYWQQSGGGGATKAEKAGKKGAGKGRGPLVVKAARAVAKPMPVLIEAPGTVEAEQSVQVRAQVSGVLQAVQFKEGDYVKAGQLLFQIDPRTFQASYNQAQAALARDRAQLENARAQQQRMEPLLKREFITRQEYDVAVTSAKSLEATVQAGQAQLEQAKIQLDYTRIHAPISGRTGQLSVRAGNLVNASQGSGAPLVTINSTDPVLATFSIPERQLDEIRRALVKGEMRIEILADRSGPAVAEGKLVFVDNTVTAQTGTVLLKTRVANPQELLWPGQFVNVRVVLRVEPEAIVVPEVAVQPGQEGPFVYLIEDGKVKVQPVTVARQVGGEVVIAQGVNAGDQVLTEIPQALSPGAAVQVGEGGEPGKARQKGEKGKGKKGEAKSEPEKAAPTGGEK